MLNNPPPVTTRRGTGPSDRRSVDLVAVRDTATRARTATALPLRVTVDAPLLVTAGIRALLAEHSGTVRVGRWDDTATDVGIADVSTQHGPIRLPATHKPLVALIREGDFEARTFVREVGAVDVPVTATATSLIGALQTAHTLQQRPDVPTEDYRRGPGRELLNPLSPREIEVLNGICLGMTNTDIAAEMYLSINSVKTYIRSAYRKMGVTGRSQAILWGIDHGYKTASSHAASEPPREIGQGFDIYG